MIKIVKEGICAIIITFPWKKNNFKIDGKRKCEENCRNDKLILIEK